MHYLKYPIIIRYTVYRNLRHKFDLKIGKLQKCVYILYYITCLIGQTVITMRSTNMFQLLFKHLLLEAF